MSRGTLVLNKCNVSQEAREERGVSGGGGGRGVDCFKVGYYF